MNWYQAVAPCVVVTPFAVKVAVCPAQIVAELTATVGAEVIVTVVVTALPVHPSVLVPITLYVEVVTGDTAMLDVVAEVLHGTYLPLKPQGLPWLRYKMV